MGCELILRVDNPRTNRKSRISISNKQIGLLTIEVLDKENQARFLIPDDVFSEEGKIEVSIIPEPGNFLGWDIQSAEVVRSGL